MFTIHLVQYTTSTTAGIARIGTDHSTPSREELTAEIPGYLTGYDLGIEPKYTIRYENRGGAVVKRVGAAGVVRVGAVLMRCADRGTVWNLSCYDEVGSEVTFDFAVFCH